MFADEHRHADGADLLATLLRAADRMDITIATRLGMLMAVRGAGVLAGADAVVPVPLHRRRERTRGFNQAALLAESLGLRVLPALARVRPTEPQVDLPEAQRHRNVRDAFALKTRAIECEGKILVLVDDVSTTGATLEACARVLEGAVPARSRAHRGESRAPTPVNTAAATSALSASP